MEGVCMLFGVIIREGPQNWQIIQQENGTADVSLRGTYSLPEGMEGDARVYARLVKEDCGENVVPWTECLHHDGNRWEIVLRDVPAGGLYRIETCLNSDCISRTSAGLNRTNVGLKLFLVMVFYLALNV